MSYFTLKKIAYQIRKRVTFIYLVLFYFLFFFVLFCLQNILIKSQDQSLKTVINL